MATNDLAERLGVTPASVSAMLKKLAERGLVEHVPYRGVLLTAEGERVALEVLRHHRLLELYLAEHLGVPWDRVHEEAEALEHVISEDLEARIAAKLGDPTHDPHGDPIPSADLQIDEGDARALESLEPGDRGRFVRVSDTDPEMLRYLDERGVAARRRASRSSTASRSAARSRSASAGSCTTSAAGWPPRCAWSWTDCSVAAAAGEVRAGGEDEQDGDDAEQQEFHWPGS